MSGGRRSKEAAMPPIIENNNAVRYRESTCLRYKPAATILGLNPPFWQAHATFAAAVRANGQTTFGKNLDP